MESTVVEARSVSPRTVVDREKAMAARAALSQRTARRALPRERDRMPWPATGLGGCLLIDIRDIRGAMQVYGGLHAHGLEAGKVRVRGRHIDANRQGPAHAGGAGHPDGVGSALVAAGV